MRCYLLFSESVKQPEQSDESESLADSLRSIVFKSMTSQVRNLLCYHFFYFTFTMFTNHVVASKSWTMKPNIFYSSKFIQELPTQNKTATY